MRNGRARRSVRRLSVLFDIPHSATHCIIGSGLPIIPHSDHSHSMVLGGLLLTSYTTRLTPFTSLAIRLLITARRS